MVFFLKFAASIPLSDGAFQSPDSSNYTLAQHTVKVRRSGQITDIHLLLDMERKLSIDKLFTIYLKELIYILGK